MQVPVSPVALQNNPAPQLNEPVQEAPEAPAVQTPELHALEAQSDANEQGSPGSFVLKAHFLNMHNPLPQSVLAEQFVLDVLLYK